jgi:hypothetical protein
MPRQIQGRPTPPANALRRPTGFAVSALWAALVVSSGCAGMQLPPVVITVPTPGPGVPPVTQPPAPPPTPEPAPQPHRVCGTPGVSCPCWEKAATGDWSFRPCGDPTPPPSRLPSPTCDQAPCPCWQLSERGEWAYRTCGDPLPPSPRPPATPPPPPPPACEPRTVTSLQPPGCQKCAAALSGLESIGYALKVGDPSFYEMDNCGAGDPECSYVSRVPVVVNGVPHPACQWFNRNMKPRAWGWDKPICTEQTATIPCTDPSSPPPPVPTPPPGEGDPGASCDAAKLITLHVAENQNDPRPCGKEKGNPFKLYLDGCSNGRPFEAFLTYTPKRADGSDAKIHGRDLTRWIETDEGQRILIPELRGEGDCVPAGAVQVCGHYSAEDLFNLTLKPVRVGTYKLSTRLRCGGRELWSEVENDGRVVPGQLDKPGAGGEGGGKPGRRPRPGTAVADLGGSDTLIRFSDAASTVVLSIPGTADWIDVDCDAGREAGVATANALCGDRRGLWRITAQGAEPR